MADQTRTFQSLFHCSKQSIFKNFAPEDLTTLFSEHRSFRIQRTTDVEVNLWVGKRRSYKRHSNPDFITVGWQADIKKIEKLAKVILHRNFAVKQIFCHFD